MRAIFWIAALFVAYTYAGYPLWLFLRRRQRPRNPSPRPTSSRDAAFPLVSIVIAAHNEAGTLPRKLRNLAELDYPAERCEVIVVSDGSTDGTEQWMQEHRHDRLHFYSLPQHAGKAIALNRAIEAARGEIVIFTDARQIIQRDAVQYLVTNFVDPDVGCVSGELILGDAAAVAAGKGLGLYWRLEKKIREWEAASGSVVGATGALYAVRRGLLVPVPPGTLLDDVYLPLHVVRQGKRVLFEPRARAYDSVANPEREFRRKVRTLTGNYQLLRLAPWVVTQSNAVRFRFISHKLFRLGVPFALLALLVASAALRSPFYETALLAQVVFYGLGLLALWRRRLGFLARWGDMSLAFVLMNSAAAVALFWFLIGKKEIWARSEKAPAILNQAHDV